MKTPHIAVFQPDAVGLHRVSSFCPVFLSISLCSGTRWTCGKPCKSLSLCYFLFPFVLLPAYLWVSCVWVRCWLTITVSLWRELQPRHLSWKVLKKNILTSVHIHKPLEKCNRERSAHSAHCTLGKQWFCRRHVSFDASSCNLLAVVAVVASSISWGTAACWFSTLYIYSDAKQRLWPTPWECDLR